MCSAAAFRLDLTLVRWCAEVRESHGEWLSAPVAGLSAVSTPAIVLGVTAAGTVAAAVLWRNAQRRVPWEVPAAAMGAEVVSKVAKLLIDRPRPPIEYRYSDVWAPVIGDSSMPSGHAMVACAVAAAVSIGFWRSGRRSLPGRWPFAAATRGGSEKRGGEKRGGKRHASRARLIVVLAWSWAVAVMASRIYLGVHWPSDVAVGAILGGLIGVAAGLVTPLRLFHCATPTAVSSSGG